MSMLNDLRGIDVVDDLDNVYARTTRLKFVGFDVGFDELEGEATLTADVSLRTIATTAPLAGGGDLSADRTLSITPGTNNHVLTTVAGVVQWAALSATESLTWDGPTVLTLDTAPTDGQYLKRSGTTVAGDSNIVLPSGYLSIGSHSVTTGAIRLANGDSIYSETNGGTDVRMLSVLSGNDLSLGYNYSGTVSIDNTGALDIDSAYVEIGALSMPTDGLIRLQRGSAGAGTEKALIVCATDNGAANISLVTSNYGASADAILFGDTTDAASVTVGAASTVTLKVGSTLALSASSSVVEFGVGTIQIDKAIGGPAIVHEASTSGHGSTLTIAAQSGWSSGDYNGGALTLNAGIAGGSGVKGTLTLGWSSVAVHQITQQTYGPQTDIFGGGTSSGPDLRVYRSGTGPGSLESAVWIYIKDEGLVRISAGATDSGGSGKRALTIPN